MTLSLLRNLALGLAAVALPACTSNSRDTSSSGERNKEVTTSDKTAKANMKEGWEDVKEGTEQTATGVGQKTKDVAREVSADIKEAGNEMKASACPVVANRTTKRYYTQSNKDYATMLKGEKILSPDNRECFMSERAAMDDGYTRAR